MGYIVDTKYFTEFPPTEEIKDSFNIVNNESIIFDFNDYILENEQDYTISKIIIKFGDGTTEKLIKPIQIIKNKINTKNSWCITEHFYNIVEDLDGEKNITITFITDYGEAVERPYNFNILENNILDYGANFEIVNANITNDKNVSYVFKNMDHDLLIFAQTKNTK